VGVAEPRSGQGRSGSLGARQASATPIRYGTDLLATESRDWPRYLLVTSPSAEVAARGRLATRPAAIVHVTSLDFDELERVTAAAPSDVGLVVGAGGGQALDAAKHVAATKRVRLVQVPTIVSSGAIVHGYLATFRGSQAVGTRADWVWADSDAVLVDYDLVLGAPAHLNTAGLGDILCEYSGVAEWKVAHRTAPRPRDAAAELGRLLAFHRSLAHGFEATLHRGELTAPSIRCITESLRERDSHRVHLASAPQVDHHFLAALETVSGRRWIHGEVVALGAVVITWAAGSGAEALCSRLDRCRVRWRPCELGLRRRDLEATLDELARALSASEADPVYSSVMRTTTWTGPRVEALWRFLNGGDPAASRRRAHRHG
jgi:glycerol dehydrogenase-like iron-containing ADH family enzyme